MNLPTDAAAVKACCADLYQHEAARLLVGDTLHPGGLELTERLCAHLGLGPGAHLLDIASGAGASALHLAEKSGCRVTGVDYGSRSVAGASAAADARGLSDRVTFRQADAEALPFDDGAFDAVLCECAFCLFPDKARAAREIARVLKPGGRFALSDLTRQADLPPELAALLAWVACIADARPLGDYVGALTTAGLVVTQTESHDGALAALVDTVRFRLLGADVLIGLGKLNMDREDLATAKQLAIAAEASVRRGDLGYEVLVAEKAA